MKVYVDTSALAKWYLNEAGAEEFENYLMRVGPVAISSLTILEMRSLLARRRREGHFDSSIEMRVFEVFQDDIRNGYLHLYPLEDEHALAAARFISTLSAHPLRSLDALHLAIAKEYSATTLATADRAMVKVAEKLGMEVVRFD